MFINPQADALIISTLPALAVMFVYAFSHQKDRRGLYFVLGFIIVTEYYVVALDPSVVAALYTSQGNYTFPLELAAIDFVLLFIAVFFFRKHLDT